MGSFSWMRSVFYKITLSLLLILVACGKKNQSSDPDSPQISYFSFVKQLPTDPQTAVFKIHFSARSKINQGKVLFFMGSQDSDPLELPLSEILLNNGISDDVLEGDIGVAIRFATPEQAKASYILYVQIEDNEDRRSNLAQIKLDFVRKS